MLRIQRFVHRFPSALVVGVSALSILAALQACGGAILDEQRDNASGVEADEDEWCTGYRGARYRCGGTRGSGPSRGGGRCSGRGC